MLLSQGHTVSRATETHHVFRPDIDLGRAGVLREWTYDCYPRTFVDYRVLPFLAVAPTNTLVDSSIHSGTKERVDTKARERDRKGRVERAAITALTRRKIEAVLIGIIQNLSFWENFLLSHKATPKPRRLRPTTIVDERKSMKIQHYFAFFALVAGHISCGSSIPEESRQLIVGGQESDPTRFPYYVRLDYDGDFACGGTLLRRDMVITAAHCAYTFLDVDKLNATVSAINHGTFSNTKSVLQIIHHPRYYVTSEMNDVSLLQIEAADEDIQAIQTNSDPSVPAVGEPVTVVGLGSTVKGGGGTHAEDLQDVELSVLDDEFCDERYEVFAEYSRAMICVFNPNQGSCEGDAGGPLVRLGETPADDVLVGVVSAEECAHDTIPGTSIDVSYVNEWIQSMICTHSTDPPQGCSEGGSTAGSTAEDTAAPTAAPPFTSRVLDPDDSSFYLVLGALLVAFAAICALAFACRSRRSRQWDEEDDKAETLENDSSQEGSNGQDRKSEDANRLSPVTGTSDDNEGVDTRLS